MANTNLTSTVITKEALTILHQKLNFVGTINRQYDNRFAQTGAKIGETLQIRKPVKLTTRTGATIDVQDATETKVDLTVSTQKGVDLSFSSKELSLDIDDFSMRYLEPAMSTLAATIENDSFNMYKDVYNAVNNAGSAMTFANLLNGRKKLTDELAPTSNRCVQFDTQANVDLVDSLKGLFQDSSTIAKQYREGMVGRTAGFGEIYENTLLPRHTVGSQDGNYVVDGASQTGATLTVKTGTGTLKQGDVFTIAGVFRVHPETRVSTGVLQQFVVTADYAGGGGNVSISPSITTSGAYQTVSGSPADAAVITVLGTASTAHGESLAYHRDAFAFVTADLEMPENVHFAAREMLDGISMRIVRNYDINNDQFPCRIDVLYGYKTIREQLACRLMAN